jgi:TonB family protein
MAHQWPSFPKPESPETTFAPRLDAKKPGSPARPLESEALRLLDTLRGAVTAGGLDLDAQLHEITETAQKLTDASAAALAVRSHGVVICRARVGETAPAIGAKVDVDSGISGECLRTGKALRCDDTSRDQRVDAEVCRHLGLRSLAVVPLRSRRGVAGVLEVFSAQPHGFADRHMDLLAQLAEMAETVSAGHWNRGNRARLMIVGAALIVALSVTGWMLMRERPNPPRMPSDVAQAAAEPEGATRPASAANPPHMSKVAVPKPSRMIKPSAARTADSQDFAERRVQRAQKVEVESNADRFNPNARLQTPAPGVGQRTAENASGVEATAPIPSGVAENLSSTLSAVLSAPLNLPQRTVTISQGVSEGRLQHRVLPEYPAQARSLRLEGPVVLDAMVMEDGSVHDIKVVSGHPTLARPALDAVRQWRYQPYRLNGKPVAMRTVITIKFKLP